MNQVIEKLIFSLLQCIYLHSSAKHQYLGRNLFHNRQSKKVFIHRKAVCVQIKKQSVLLVTTNERIILNKKRSKKHYIVTTLNTKKGCNI